MSFSRTATLVGGSSRRPANLHKMPGWENMSREERRRYDIEFTTEDLKNCGIPGGEAAIEARIRVNRSYLNRDGSSHSVERSE